jgi:dienelactone hydrolase
MKRTVLLVCALFSSVTFSHGALVERDVEYKDGDKVFQGFHVFDDAVSGKRPAVLVVHQWTGLSNYEKSRSRMLAELGYNVFAVDIYGKGVRPPVPVASAEEAGKYKKDRALYRSRLQLGLDVLLKDERTDTNKVAAIGYCFGGGGVLELVRMKAPLLGVVSFHGSLDAGEGMNATPWTKLPKILVLHGADDPYAPMKDVAALQSEMKVPGADLQVVLYSGAVHSFTQVEAGNDLSKGAAYNADADRRSWLAMKNFLEEIFGK